MPKDIIMTPKTVRRIPPFSPKEGGPADDHGADAFQQEGTSSQDGLPRDTPGGEDGSPHSG